MEPNSPKKIQFSVPLFQSQLDPQAAEHIRRRRPTPATLVFYSEPSVSEAEDRKRISSQTENAELFPAQRKQSVYTPPTMKEGKLLKTPSGSSFPEEEEGLNEPEPEPVPKELKPRPKEPESLLPQPEPLPKELEGVIQQGGRDP